MSSGPLAVSTASRCCGLSWERKDKRLRPLMAYNNCDCRFPIADFRLKTQGISIGNAEIGNRSLSRLCGQACCFTFLARAHIPQKLPGINSQLMTIVPVELDGIFANAFG